MARARIVRMVRHFRENGLKDVLELPGNVRDLLALAGAPHLDRLDFGRMKVERTSYVAADYRHLSSDLVVTIPLRQGRGQGTLTLYVLIEHQSEPDALMVLRVLEYLVHIYKGQLRDWERRHGSRAGFRLRPVLPIVLYTGTATWESLGRLADLVEGGELFPETIPDFTPLFVSLPALPSAALESAGGAFGWVLEVIQQRQARPDEFAELLVRVVNHLEGMPPAERERWLRLLSYLAAIIYHDRAPAEREGLKELILASVRTDERRREVEAVIRTIADELREEGMEQGRREGEVRAGQKHLMLVLRARFKKVPKVIERTIKATDDTARLGEWLERAATASTLDQVGIVGES
ncbi:MAG TPA: Rpn family recombination-promoting nuclease/putative transposase [Gemmataceae bacterium]|nr:Rpn family recombination-promoting nuclease/putative transposase [Gemmataceae bacterium]